MQALVDVTLILSVLVVLWMAWLAWRSAKDESVGMACQRCGAPDSSQLWTTRDDWGRYVHHWVCPACKAQLEATTWVVTYEWVDAQGRARQVATDVAP